MRVAEVIHAEIIASFALAVVVGVLFGWFESMAASSLSAFPLVIFDHFSLWNVAMFILALAIFAMSLLGAFMNQDYVKGALIVVADLFLFSVLEDASYFLFLKSWPNPSSWVNWVIGGHYLAGVWIPYFYVIGAAASIVFYVVATLLID